MKVGRWAKTVLASFAVCSMLQFGLPNITYTEEQSREQIFADKASKFENSYNHLKKETNLYLKSVIDDENSKKTKESMEKRMEKIYSGSIVNEEIGLGIVLFKYKHREDRAYLIMVKTDCSQTRGLEDNFKLLGNTIVTLDLDYLNSELEKSYELAKDEEFMNDDGVRIMGERTVKVSDNSYSAHNIPDFDEIKNGETIYFGVPYFEKGKGCNRLLYSLSFKTVNDKILVEGRGEGGKVLEGPFYETETLQTN